MPYHESKLCWTRRCGSFLLPWPRSFIPVLPLPAWLLLMSSPRFNRLYARSVFYPTLAWNYMLARVLKARRWWDRIDPHVIVGAYPFGRDVEGLYKEGVRAVVNTCEEYAGPILQYERHGIDQLRIPTTDFTHPRLKDTEQAVDFIQKHVEAGNSVYIHCKAGRARSATVAMCWLMKYRGLSIDEAQSRLLETRPHVHPQLTGRPVVREFAQSILHRPAESSAAE